jgi:hypothetical protein
MSNELIPAHLIESSNQEKGVSFYPLPSSDDYEKFLQKIKKEQCNFVSS